MSLKPEQIGRLFDAFWHASPVPLGEYAEARNGLYQFTIQAINELAADVEQAAAMKKRGWQGLGKAWEVIRPRLELYAAAIAAYEAPTAEDAPCRATDQDGRPCRATDQDGRPCGRIGPHEAHTYINTEVGLAIEVESGGKIVEVVVASTSDTCGAFYNDTDNGDPCLLHAGHVDDKDFQHHQARNSRWPVRDGERTQVATASQQPASTAVASPHTEADDLGTPPLPFEPATYITGVIPPAGTVVDLKVTGHQAEVIKSGVPKSFSLGYDVAAAVIEMAAEGVAVPDLYQHLAEPAPEAPVQPSAPIPDPFTAAIEPRHTATWRPEPEPRPLILPPPVPGEIPRSIRVTHVRTGEQCGMAYRLLTRDKVDEVPSWWNIGGTALQACFVRFEEVMINHAMAHPERDFTDTEARQWFEHAFNNECATQSMLTPQFPEHVWRAADKGTEGREWWLQHGPAMLRDYAAASQEWRADGWYILHLPDIPGPPDPVTLVGTTVVGPAMELEMRIPLLAPDTELIGHLDFAWIKRHEDGVVEIRIRDAKSGSRVPDDPWQLDAYAIQLRQRLAGMLSLPLDQVRISAVYYDARNGRDTEPWTVVEASAGTSGLAALAVANALVGKSMEVVYRAGSVHGMHAANNYPANAGSDWKAPCYLCPVRYACPIMARKDQS